jgi:hypothetical protein
MYRSDEFISDAWLLLTSHTTRMCTRIGGGPFGVPPELENMINHTWCANF